MTVAERPGNGAIHLVVLRALQSGWWIVLATGLLGTAAAAVVTSLTTPTYRSSTSYFVSVAGQDAASAGDIVQGSAAAQQKIASYTELASSPRVLQPVIDELGLHTDTAALATRVLATVRSGTVIITVTATADDRAAARRLAATIGSTLSTVVSEIEPRAADGSASVRLEAVAPATEPGAPVSPRPRADIAAGGAGGLAVGAALAVLRAAVDTRIRTADDLDEGVPVVGDVAFDADAGRRPLIVRDESDSARAEAFRTLRTNIQFLRPGGSSTIAVTSARPAEGKTTTAANLAIVLGRGGARTVLIDADLRRPNIARTMGIEGAVGLTDLLVGRAELDDVLQPWGVDGLSVLPAGTIPPNPSELIGSDAMAAVLADLAERFDVVLVDTPPLLAVSDAAIISTLVATTLMVCAATQTRRSDVRQACEALARVGEDASGIVLTKTRTGTTMSGYYLRTEGTT